jgi:hypothetical protein
MATKKKAAKKAKAAATSHDLELLAGGGIKPTRRGKIKHGDMIRIFCKDDTLCFDVTVTATEVPCLGIGGGPIIIHS